MSVASLLRRSRPVLANRELWPLFALNLLLGLGYSFVGPFLSLFGTIEVGMSPFAYGVFMMVNAIGGIVIGTGVAHYSDTHWSRRSTLITGSIAGAVGYALFAFVRSVPLLTVIGAFVIGLSSITFSQLFAYARERIGHLRLPESEAAFFMNVFRMFFALSWTISPAIASWILVHGSFEVLFLCAAAIFLGFTGVTLRWVDSVPPSAASHGREGGSWRYLTRPDMAAHFAAFVAFFCAATMGMANLPLLILKTLQGEETQIGIAYSVAPIFELPFMLYFGWLATKRDAAGLIRIGLGLAIAYYALLAVVQAPWQVYPVQIVSAAVTAVTAGVAITYFQSHLPKHPGMATNLYATAQRIGSTAGYFAFGTVAQAHGHRAVFVLCAGLGALAFALMFVGVRAGPED
ncbi:sugar efflux transporter [Nibricoccus sp. IMCC34717]|uniref:sugar efflux transporter n=1 Tax=Nibricoccus sp. IMCC34717 TaxID=3034021 RepID=UPI00384E8C90